MGTLKVSNSMTVHNSTNDVDETNSQGTSMEKFPTVFMKEGRRSDKMTSIAVSTDVKVSNSIPKGTTSMMTRTTRTTCTHKCPNLGCTHKCPKWLTVGSTPLQPLDEDPTPPLIDSDSEGEDESDEILMGLYFARIGQLYSRLLYFARGKWHEQVSRSERPF